MAHQRTIGRVWLAAAAVCVCACELCADTVVLKGGKSLPKLDVQQLTSTNVVCAGGKTFPVADVDTVQFEAFRVAPKWSGIVLVDGSRVGGVVRRTGPREVLFRSVSFGEITLRRADIAGLYYAPTTIKEMQQASVPGNGGCAILLRDGKVLSGKLMWADLKSVGALVGKKLEKIPSADVKAVVLRRPALSENVVLRNDDRLVGIHVTDDAKLRAIVAGAEVTVPLKALLSVKLKPALEAGIAGLQDRGAAGPGDGKKP